MIDSPSDYEFVTGITNGQVIINGHILPWRDVNYDPAESPPTDKPECLRGEDMCFLYEALARLLNSGLAYSFSPWTYEKKLSRLFLNQRCQYMATLWDETYYGNTLRCVNDQFQTTYYTSNGQGLKDDFNIAFPNHMAKRANRASDYTYYNIRWDSTIGGYAPVPLSLDQLRRIFYDLYRLRCFVVIGQSTTTTGVESVHVAEREMGDSRADYAYEMNKSYPSWGAIGSGYGRRVIGEAVYHTQRPFGGGNLYLERARAWEASSTGYVEETSNTGAEFGKYLVCTSALLELHTNVRQANNNYPMYTKPTTCCWAVVPATMVDTFTVRIQMSDIMPIAKSYATNAGVYSQFFTQGRSPVGWINGLGSGSLWNSAIEVEARFNPIWTIPDDINFKSIDWTWTPT